MNMTGTFAKALLSASTFLSYAHFSGQMSWLGIFFRLLDKRDCGSQIAMLHIIFIESFSPPHFNCFSKSISVNFWKVGILFIHFWCLTFRQMSLAAHWFGRVEFRISNMCCCFLKANSWKNQNKYSKFDMSNSMSYQELEVPPSKERCAMWKSEVFLSSSYVVNLIISSRFCSSTLKNQSSCIIC